MKVLVVGGGGREHAIIWKLKQNNRIDTIYCAPGNGGISQIAVCVDIKATDIESVVAFSKRKKIGLVVVAPDDPLYLGMVDALEEAGIRAFGPKRSAALIEGSKVYAKNMMKKYGIPTAAYAVFDDYEQAKQYLAAVKLPVVLKADGLALGKGVLICETREEAYGALDKMMKEKAFGAAGDRIVIEEYISGPEVSILSFCDGKTIVPMVSVQDHKRIFDNDRGKNTGGMGAFSPTLKYTKHIEKQVEKEIILPTLDAMNAEGRPFKGVLYFGLMLCKDGPKVLEYNARFGDPEAQVVLPLLKTDLLDIIEAIMDERLDTVDIQWSGDAAVCVVLASGGYPDQYEKGKEITGLGSVDGDVIVFHAGTTGKDGNIYTSGGRVLGVTATGKSIEQARKKAYSNVEKIRFEGAQYRNDIGIK